MNRLSLVDGHSERVFPHSLRRLTWDDPPWTLLLDNEGLVVLEAGRSEPIRLPEIKLAAGPVRALRTRGTGSAKCYVTDGRSAWLVGLEAGGPSVEQVPVGNLPARRPFVWFDGRRYVVWPGCRRGELIFGSLDGSERVLLPSRK